MVEDEKDICDMYREQAQKQQGISIVYDTGSEQQALLYLKQHKIDVMILDLELKEGDGISLLDLIRDESMEKPFTVVVTNTVSNVTLSYVRTHGADFIYQKLNASYSPNHVLRFIEKVYPYNHYAEVYEDRRPALLAIRRELAATALQKSVREDLEYMGFKHKMSGFDYLMDAIIMCVNSEADTIFVTSQIYPEIAKKRNTTQTRVERAIRWAIERVFVKADIHKLHKGYPFRYDPERGRPTNAQFILNMASKYEKRSV